MKKLITPKRIPAVIIMFYLIAVTLCILLSFQYSKDARYYSPSGAFSIQLPGEWAVLPVSFPESEFSLFPKLADPDGEQLTLVSAHWKLYEELPFTVSVRQVQKKMFEKLIGKKSSLKEFWQYLQDYQQNSPTSLAMENIENFKPNYTLSDLSDISEVSEVFTKISSQLSPGSFPNPQVTETRYYTYFDFMGPYIIQISALETANYYYIFAANGESDFSDISTEQLKQALSTITP